MNNSVKMLKNKKGKENDIIDLDAYAIGLSDMYDYLRNNNKGLEPMHFNVEIGMANRFREIKNKLKLSSNELFEEMLETHANGMKFKDQTKIK